ncbi:MAG: ABC transporter ATP-binding protein [Frankiales bacterium]|nr:ABC transporter ATP-binding protein [Frankiales bacterium]
MGHPGAVTADTATGAVIRVRGVDKAYRNRGGEPVVANRAIDLDVGRGEVVGLLGPNGAGKSTLVRQLVGLARPDRGSISLLGHDVVARPRLSARFVGYLAQTEPALDDLSVSSAIETTARLRGVPRREATRVAAELVDELDLGDVSRRPLARLSGGQRRLACVAAALAGDRPVLVLDEPTTGLDPSARRGVWGAIARRRERDGTTVVLVTHNVVEAEQVLDRVAILDDGIVIACDTPGRLKAAVTDDVRLELVWREPPPYDDATVAMLASRARVEGRRWQVRLPHAEARPALDRLLTGPAYGALDDFTLATPSLEDVYLALGGRSDDLERE